MSSSQLYVQTGQRSTTWRRATLRQQRGCSPTVTRIATDWGGNPRRFGSTLLRLAGEGPPRSPLRSFRLPATDRSGEGGDPHKTTRTRPTARRAIVMSPRNDRRTSPTPVSPFQGQPDTAVTAFSSSRLVIHSSSESIRHVSKAHQGVHATEIIRAKGEQNHARTGDLERISRNSCPFDTASSCQYRGRRRHGPARQAFPMA